MKADDILAKSINEAEKYTSASRKIRTSLRKAGYKLLGSGADATVWAKSDGPVIKIIMPDDHKGSGIAGDTFMKFYEFCKAHPDWPNLPRFKDEEVDVFTEDGKDYIMVTMERLEPIPNNSFEEAMVWILSDGASSNKSWEELTKIIVDPNTWNNYGGELTATEIVSKFNSMKKYKILQWEILFNIMKLLYHRGRINKLGWDLHTENAMLRSSGTIVITDPWFTSQIQ